MEQSTMSEYERQTSGRIKYTFGDDADAEDQLLTDLSWGGYRVLIRCRDGSEITGTLTDARPVSNGHLALVIVPETEAHEEVAGHPLEVAMTDIDGIHIW